MTEACPRCDGTGRLVMGVGPRMRARREKAGISMRQMAKLLHISPSYLSALELNQRTGWSSRLVARVRALT